MAARRVALTRIPTVTSVFAPLLPVLNPLQFGIYESIRRELIGRQDRANAGWLPPTVQKTLELGGRFGPRQQGTLRDVVDNIAESSRRR